MNPGFPVQSSTSLHHNQMINILPAISNSLPNIVNGELSFISLRNVIYGANLLRLQRELEKILIKEPQIETDNEDVLFSDMTVQPNYWVSKWVDDINNNGFGYQLSDNTVGAIFRDGTMLIKAPDNDEFEYHDIQGTVSAILGEAACSTIKLKIQFLAYTQNYMSTNLVKTDTGISQNREQVAPRPYVHTFWRLKNAVIMHLIDGTLQLNFFDHIKIILCLSKESVTFIDENNLFQSYKFSELQQGCLVKLYQRLNYAKCAIDEMIQKNYY